MFALSDYDYTLPEECIAQTPAAKRENSRLLVLNRPSGAVAHHHFFELGDFLTPKDILVVNNTKVVPGRIFGRKKTGGQVEVLILDYVGGLEKLRAQGEFECQCLLRASKRAKIGSRIFFTEDLSAVVTGFADNIYTLCFEATASIDDLLERIGHMPLPPYIRRDPQAENSQDRASYQTVYAAQNGAIAAPTAGLHFSNELMMKIKSMGVTVASLTLHVGYGTFLPVRVDDIRRHHMHPERYTLSPETAAAINAARDKGGRVIAVGTTAVRTLEHLTDKDGRLVAGTGVCDLFIYPGYTFRMVDAMITNFHLPQSTLLMLVSAFAGRESILRAYAEAIQLRYRFYSYGDAMLII